ncbi:MAG: Cyclic nucleotide-gated potassium channel [Betaproteobacteria bacterium ADurb.Bin341]|nr:MAG: Cyclic nucleotide-gated potassium channel [Betaproteobacteria bacterium ADurb.Bin341]
MVMFEFLRGRSSGADLRLSGTSLFSGLSRVELKTLEGFTHTRHYLPGEIIFDQGEEGQALYIVISGRVLICHPGEVESPIAELGPGSFFGELALLDDTPRSAQARAGTETELAALFRGDFERLMETHARIASRIALQLARNLGQRLRQAVSRPQEAT